MKKRKKKYIEYEDAPSGTVYFYNYKEPLIRFEKGHGYVGALMFDSVSDKVQCHLCGDWFDSVSNHIRREHNVLAADYKEMVGLNQSTALINEKYRAVLIKNGLERRMKNLRVNKKHTKASREKIATSLRAHNAEKQNTRGTCPAQLLDRLVALHDKLGRTPKWEEVGFIEALKRVYGTYKQACEFAGIPHRPNGNTVKHGRYHKYTADELIEYLRIFEKTNKRKPSSSDGRRGLIPVASVYQYHFGSWKKALQAAFPQ